MRRSALPLSVRETLVAYALWLILAATAGWVAWQWHVTLIVLFNLWLASDLPRPIGWTAATLVGISRASLLVNGALWLMWSMYLESDLRHHAGRKRLGVRSLQIVAVYTAIVVVCYVAITLLA